MATDVVGSDLLHRATAIALGGRLDDVSAAAHCCFFVMAFVARDKTTKDAPARTYFAGWEYLARVALGYSEYDETARRAMSRAIKELIDVGVIKPTGRRHGVRQGMVMYELIV